MTEGELILYTTEDGKTKIEVHLVNETVWLTQKQMGELFQKDVRTVSEHIRNVFEEGELSPDSTIRNFRIVQSEGQRQVERDVAHYNLNVIISVGYRVKSHKGEPSFASGPPSAFVEVKEWLLLHALHPECIPQQLALPLKCLTRILGVFHQ